MWFRHFILGKHVPTYKKGWYRGNYTQVMLVENDDVFPRRLSYAVTLLEYKKPVGFLHLYRDDLPLVERIKHHSTMYSFSTCATYFHRYDDAVECAKVLDDYLSNGNTISVV